MLGVPIFSYVMAEFSEQIKEYNISFGDTQQDGELNDFLTHLENLNKNGKNSPRLLKEIQEHFRYIWTNNRMISISKKDKFLQNIPKEIKTKLVEYLWNDVLTTFNKLLMYKDYKDMYYEFYYQLGFLMFPRKFRENEVIFEAGEEVEEFYLIIDGSISISPNLQLENQPSKIDDSPRHTLYKGDYFGVFSCLYNVDAEYKYYARETCKVLGVNKIRFLQLMEQYPVVRDNYRINEYLRYKTIKAKFDEKTAKFISNLNKSSENSGEKLKFSPWKMVEIDENLNGFDLEKHIGDYKRGKKEVILSAVSKVIDKKIKVLLAEVDDCDKDEYYKEG